MCWVGNLGLRCLDEKMVSLENADLVEEPFGANVSKSHLGRKGKWPDVLISEKKVSIRPLNASHHGAITSNNKPSSFTFYVLKVMMSGQATTESENIAIHDSLVGNRVTKRVVSSSVEGNNVM